MVSIWPVVEITAVCTIELIQTVQHVFRSMGMYDVQHYVKSFTVCDIDQFLEFFGCSKTAEI